MFVYSAVEQNVISCKYKLAQAVPICCHFVCFMYSLFSCFTGFDYLCASVKNKQGSTTIEPKKPLHYR